MNGRHQRGKQMKQAILLGFLLSACAVAVPDDTNPDLASPPPRAVAAPPVETAGATDTTNEPNGTAPFVPTGPLDTSSAIGFALTTSHGVGEKKYQRLPILGGVRMRRACAEFASADAAQTAFLAAGGPDRDPKGMDPDGDGFACDWSPEPYRQAVSE